MDIRSKEEISQFLLCVLGNHAQWEGVEQQRLYKVKANMDRYDQLYVATAFSLQILLLIYFIVRKLNFHFAIRWGWLIFALAIPVLMTSLVLLKAGKAWIFWIGGFIFTTWAVFGFLVDFVRPVPWRSPVYLPVFIPYIVLYLGSLMFYWWPLGMLKREFWYAYAVLFAASSYFNITSHQ